MALKFQTAKSTPITPILKSLQWLKVSERIISLTCKILNITQPSYLYDLISIQPPHGHNTRSSPYLCHSDQTIIITQSHSPLLPTCFTSSLESASYHSGFLIQIIHPPLSDLHLNMPVLTCYTLLSLSITFSMFHSELKTYLFRKSYPPP